MKKTYKIEPQKCECGLLEFYENAAKAIGLKITDKTEYDCRKICITKPIQDLIWKYYYDNGHSNYEIAALFLQCGPKANLPGNDFIFEVEPGFAMEGDHE